MKNISFTGSTNPVSMTMYSIVNRKIERLCHILYIVIGRVTIPGVLIPALLITIVNYFVNNFGSESFYLPVLVVYVLKFDF